MTVGLSLAPMGSTAPKSLVYLTPGNTNTDIPIYVYATVTGVNNVTTGSATTGDFDGLQYLYYNVLNAGSTELAGGIDTAVGPTLNTTLGFNANGSQVGVVQNVANGVSVGANPSSVVMTAYAKPRSASAVFDNATPTSDTTDIFVSGNSVSFLVETLQFKPSAFTSANKSGGKLSTTFSIQVPSLGVAYTPSNYFLDATSTNTSAGSLASVTNTAYTAGSSVTLTDTILGDLNGDGSVNILDFNTLVSDFGKTGQTYAQGDIDGNGSVNILDFNTLVSNFGFTVGNAPSVVVLARFAATHGDKGGFNSALDSNPSYLLATSSVPEPTTLSFLAGGLSAALLRRRRPR